jgi:hypothetical protein
MLHHMQQTLHVCVAILVDQAFGCLAGEMPSPLHEGMGPDVTTAAAMHEHSVKDTYV